MGGFVEFQDGIFVGPKEWIRFREERVGSSREYWQMNLHEHKIATGNYVKCWRWWIVEVGWSLDKVYDEKQGKLCLERFAGIRWWTGFCGLWWLHKGGIWWERWVNASEAGRTVTRLLQWPRSEVMKTWTLTVSYNGQWSLAGSEITDVELIVFIISASGRRWSSRWLEDFQVMKWKSRWPIKRNGK